MAAETADNRTWNPWWEGAYDRWLAQQVVPVHTGIYVEDFRTLERGWWSLRGCPSAILNLLGHRGVTEARVLEIPPGETIPAFRMAIEEVIYVAEGQGIATVWANGYRKVSFEWQKHSLFHIPTNYWYQLSNARGDRAALTLHVSYLPLAMASHPNPEFFFANPYVDPGELHESEGSFYSASARAARVETDRGGRRSVAQTWYANFFPDLTLWDKLNLMGQGVGAAYSGGIQFPNSAMRTGMLVLPSRRYKAAHRHGPGVTIVGIQDAQGIVIMWPEEGEKVVCPWHEGSVFVPPNGWYHQHMNTGAVENRQLRIFPARPIMNYTYPDPKKVIPFVEEDPWIRQKFEEQLAKNGLTSLMPPEGYTDPSYQWPEEWSGED